MKVPWDESSVELPSGAIRVLERGEGPTLIWSHGVLHPIALEELTPLREFFDAIQGRRVVRYDARGHGGSAGGRSDAANRWDELGADLLELAGALEIDRFVATGASMGAAASLYAALRAPERIAALGPDVIKLPFPSATDSPDRWERACRSVAGAIDVPWAVLSWGAPFDVFVRQTEVACANGCSGFMAGRAIWSDAVHASDRAAALREVARVLRPRGVLIATVPAFGWLWSHRDDDATGSLIQQDITVPRHDSHGDDGRIGRPNGETV